MVFVEPSKSINVHGLWLDEKRNRFFVLQRHRAAETALGSSLQLVRNILGPASGADGYRIIASTSPYHQVASAFDHQEILQDWGWIEEHLMPLAERVEGRDFRILAIKYFSDLARGKPFHLPRIGSVHVDLNRLDKQEVLEEQRKDLPDEEEIAVLGPDNPDEDAVDEVDLDTDDAMSPRSAYGGEWTDKIIGTDADPSVSSSETTDFSAGDKETRPDLQAASGAENGESVAEWPGLQSMPEQFTHPEEAFSWLRAMARGTEYDGWRYVEEEAGVTFYKKEVEGPGGKREIYKGVVVIDAPAKNIFEMINKAEKWPKWDRTLSKVQLLDRVDDKNEIVHMHIKKFFPSFSSLAQAVNMSKRAENERDMVVFKSWGRHERDSYVLYLRSVDYDKLAPEPGVMRMETDGCGFLVEPMNSIFPSSAFRSPLSQSSGVAAASIVTFVSDIDWKGWLTPIMGEYVHFTKVMLLKEIRNSFTPDLAFVGRRSTAALPSAEDEQHHHHQQESQQYSFQSAMKGFTTFVEEKKKQMIEERERRKRERSKESADETPAESEEEREIGMLDKLKAMLDTAKASDKPTEGTATATATADAEGDTAIKSDKGLWGQWKQALTLKTATGAATTDSPSSAGDETAGAAAATPTPDSSAPTQSMTSGWLSRVKGALAKDESATGASAPAVSTSAAGEAKKASWFGRATGSPAESATAEAKSPAGPDTNGGGSSWLNRMKESVAVVTAKKSDESGMEKGWLERMKEAVKTKEATNASTTGAPGDDGSPKSEQKTLTVIKFSIMEDEQENNGKGKEVEKHHHDEEDDPAEETRKQQHDDSSTFGLI